MTDTAIADNWRHLLPFGYAPGKYLLRCRGCNETVWNLDKYARRCRPCAEAAHANYQQFEPAGENVSGDGI